MGVFRIKVEEHASLILLGSEKFAIGSGGSAVHTWLAASQDTQGYPVGPLDCTSSSDMSARGHVVSCPQIYANGAKVAHRLNPSTGQPGAELFDDGVCGKEHF